MSGKIIALCVCPVARGPMQRVEEVEAIAGCGLKGDRYATGSGSYNKGKQGKRQVTFINALFFKRSGFRFEEGRRNIIVDGTELMDLIDKEFSAGGASFRGIKYCDPCRIPTDLAKQRKRFLHLLLGLFGWRRDFRKSFFDRGGLIAEVIEGGLIRIGDPLMPPPKNYKTE